MALATLDVIQSEDPPAAALRLVSHALTRLCDLATRASIIRDIRTAGLLIGIEIISPRPNSNNPRHNLPYSLT